MKRIMILVAFISMAFLPPKKITVWLIGDSTMANKEVKAFPETGWGMPFSYFFDSTVTVDNRAKNGRSTKSFIAEGLWQPVLDNLGEGDYVLIQFGHNDEVKEKVGRYTTHDEFRANLTRYVDEKSKALVQQFGPENSKWLYDYVEPGEHPNYPEGKKDDTHFSELGARRM